MPRVRSSGQQQQRDGQHGRGQNLDDRRAVERPEEQGHPKPAHARRAHRVDRHQEVDARENRAEAQNEHADDGQDHRRGGAGAVGRVERPAGVDAAEDQHQQEEDQSAHVQIQARQVQPRKRHVPAPSIKGRTKLPNDAGIDGMMNRKIMIDPCSVNSRL